MHLDEGVEPIYSDEELFVFEVRDQVGKREFYVEADELAVYRHTVAWRDYASCPTAARKLRCSNESRLACRDNPNAQSQ